MNTWLADAVYGSVDQLHPITLVLLGLVLACGLALAVSRLLSPSVVVYGFVGLVVLAPILVTLRVVVAAASS